MDAGIIEQAELLVERRKLVAATAARALAVLVLAFFSGTARSLVINSSDAAMLGELLLPSEWRLDFSWLGQASIALALCYLGLELGFSVTKCLYSYGLIRYVERPRSMWALQWVSAILLAAALAAHIAVVAANGYIAGASPLSSGSSSTSTAAEMAAASLVCGLPPALIVCLLMRLRPKGRFLRRVRRRNAWMREHHVVRWTVMCVLLAVQSCALPVFLPTALLVVILVFKAAVTIIMLPIALFLFVLILPAALNNR